MPGYTDVLGEAVPGAHGSVARGMNGRVIEPLPKRPNPDKYFIFNVSTHRVKPNLPWSFEVCLGSLGTFHIWSCEEGKDYSEPIVIKETVYEQYDGGIPPGNTRGIIRYREIPGIDVANDILGLLPPTDGASDRTMWGCFLSEHNPPLPAEVQAAKARMVETYQMCVNEANQMWEDPQEKKNISNVHRRAAKFLNYDAPWCQVIQQAIPCPGCGENLKAGVAVCKSCGAIIDREKALALGLVVPAPAVEEKKPSRRAT